MVEENFKEKIIVECPNCRQKLRIPKTTNTLRITCKNTERGTSFLYPTSKILRKKLLIG